MTKLDAVNEMLEACGEPPVTALETGEATDAGEAERILDRETTRVLERGWACNTLLEKEYTPSGGAITLTDVLTFWPMEYETRQLSMRNGALYNNTDDTATFTDSVKLNVIKTITFTYLPNMLARYIVAEAAIRFQRYLKMGTVDDAILSQHRDWAKARALKEDQDQRRENVHDSTDGVRVRGYRQRGAWYA